MKMIKLDKAEIRSLRSIVKHLRTQCGSIRDSNYRTIASNYNRMLPSKLICGTERLKNDINDSGVLLIRNVPVSDNDIGNTPKHWNETRLYMGVTINMHLKDDGSVTIFDFDSCGKGWLCSDIGCFVMNQLLFGEDMIKANKNVEKFLAGYKEIRKLIKEEEYLYPYIGIAQILYSIGIMCAEYDNYSNRFMNSTFLKNRFDLIKFWTENGCDIL